MAPEVENQENGKKFAACVPPHPRGFCKNMILWELGDGGVLRISKQKAYMRTETSWQKSFGVNERYPPPSWVLLQRRACK